MTDIELKSFQTKYKLQEDVSKIRKHILWSIKQKAGNVISQNAHTVKIPQNVAESENTATFPLADWLAIKEFLQICSAEVWNRLDPYMKEYTNELNIKEDILSSL